MQLVTSPFALHTLHPSTIQKVDIFQTNWNQKWVPHFLTHAHFNAYVFLIDVGLAFVHPNLGSSSQFFMIKTSLSKFSLPSQHRFKPMMIPTILKILSVSIYEPTISITCRTRCLILGNCYSCFAHKVKGLKWFANTVIFWKSENSFKRKPNVVSLVEARDPKTTSSKH